MTPGPDDFLQISDAAGAPGDTVVFTILLSNDTIPVSDLQFDLMFDDSALEYTDGSYTLSGPLVNWPWHEDNMIDSDHIRFAALDWNSSIPAGSADIILSFEFTVLCSGCAHGDQFDMDLTNLTGGISGFTDYDGEFTVDLCINHIGDVDFNGLITPADAALAFYIALGMYNPSADEFCRADANRDGNVTSGDALCIFKEYLGIPNECFAKSAGGPLPARDARGKAESGSLRLSIERDGLHTVEVSVVLQAGSQSVEDLQFDVRFDPRYLSFANDDWRAGPLTGDWYLRKAHCLAPGSVRFAGLDWTRAIEPGARGTVAVFELRLTDPKFYSQAISGIEVANPRGGIASYATR